MMHCRYAFAWLVGLDSGGVDQDARSTPTPKKSGRAGAVCSRKGINWDPGPRSGIIRCGPGSAKMGILPTILLVAVLVIVAHDVKAAKGKRKSVTKSGGSSTASTSAQVQGSNSAAQSASIESFVQCTKTCK